VVKSDRLIALRLVLSGLLFLWGRATLSLYRQIQAFGVTFFPTSQIWWLLFGMIFISIFGLGVLLLTWTGIRDSMVRFAQSVTNALPPNRPLLVGVIIIFSLAFSLAVLFLQNELWDLSAYRWLVFGWLTVLIALLWGRAFPNTRWLNALAIALLWMGFSYRLFQFLPDISRYPFSLGWSEASRYYYASLFYSEELYGFRISPSTLHPTRYWMQSLPFMVGALPLWFHRAWQVFLWLICSLGTGWLLSRRLRVLMKPWGLLFTIYAFLFLWQGPVYYHLLVMVMLVLWGVVPSRFWQSLLVVLLASAWAGVSRINWFPVPGMLAAVIYFLETPDQTKTDFRYLWQPAIWSGAGLLTAFLAQAIYIQWSGNAAEQFASSFTSDLLWYRLFPNATYSLGILTGALLVSLPGLFLLRYRIRSRTFQLPSISWLGLGAILAVLLIGGLVVSVKIGGGSNLHNLDAYLTVFLVGVGYLYFQRVTPGVRFAAPWIPGWLNLFLVAIPVLFTMGLSHQFVQYHPQTALDSISAIQRIASRTAQSGGKVLFISERQLITFGYVEGVPLVPEYEKVFLMEMVMAGNHEYLDAFQRDIREQRFDLIITDPLFDTLKERGESWAEENNAWVAAVSQPILCAYGGRIRFPESGVQILSPLAEVKDCP